MVDAEAFKAMHGHDDDITTQSDLTNDELENDEPPSGAFTLMLPATIKGYGFHNKKWSMFINSLDQWNAKRHHRCLACGTYTGHPME